VEPVEGEYDFSQLRRIIDRCRMEGIRLSILWFGTWKNGSMKYTPAWVKKDPKRFRRVLLPDGSPCSVLSCHCEANHQADMAAFCQMMTFLRDYDAEEKTVYAVQVENEPGIIGGTVRDFSELGEAAMKTLVPEGLLDFVAERACGNVYEVWQKNGAVRGADWDTTFGDEGSLFMQSYFQACYIESIAAAGKAIYDGATFYMNVWNDNQGWNHGGVDFPSGGAVSQVLDIYKYVTKAVEFASPDIYLADIESYRDCMAAFARDDNPLYIPESQCYGSSVNEKAVFEAIGNYQSIGHHIFGVEGVVHNDGEWREDRIAIVKSMQMVADAVPLIERYWDRSNVYAVSQNAGQGFDHLYLGDKWMAMIEFDGGKGYSDYRHVDWAYENAGKPAEGPGRGLIFQVSEDEFYIVGDMFRVHFAPRCRNGRISPILSTNMTLDRDVNYEICVEGRFNADGDFVVDRHRNGDENDFGVWARADVGVIHVKLTD